MKSHHETGLSEVTETEEYVDNYPPQQQLPEDNKNIYIEIDDLTINLEKTTSENGNNESIELDEYDGTQKDEDSDDQLKEIPPTGEYKCMTQ